MASNFDPVPREAPLLPPEAAEVALRESQTAAICEPHRPKEVVPEQYDLYYDL